MATTINLPKTEYVKSKDKSKDKDKSRPADSLAGEGSTSDKVKQNRKKKCERLNGIRKQMNMEPVSCG